jgi:VWFA-related protein
MRPSVISGNLIVFLLAASSVPAQTPPGPVPPRPGAKIQQPREQSQIRRQVELVHTPVVVRDATGEMILDLAAEDFRVYDNGVEQKVVRFDLGGEPLSVVIAIEASSRVEPLLPTVRRTGIIFTQTVLGETGEAAVLSFDDRVNELLEFTTEDEKIEKTIADLRMGTSGTVLYDALARGVQLLSERPRERRRVIIAVTEASDTGSEVKLGQVLRDAQLNNIMIYTVGLSTAAAALKKKPEPRRPVPPSPEGTFGRPPIPGTPQTPTSEQQRNTTLDLMALIRLIVERASNVVGDNSLEVATTGSGGLHVPTFSERSIETAVDQIGGELHSQYSLTYSPTGVKPTGFHDIKVEVKRRDVSVRARPGYYLPPE